MTKGRVEQMKKGAGLRQRRSRRPRRLLRSESKAVLPAKVTKYHPLSREEKQANRTLARLRLYIEHVIARLKAFSILAERYRGRCKHFGLRFNLIASTYNVEFGLKL